MMWQALLTGWKPPTEVSEELFQKLKKTKKHSALRGFVGTACTFACDMGSGGYARDKVGTNYALIRGRQLLRRVSSLKHNSVFGHYDYRVSMDNATEADVVYLDPPYANTQQYKQGIEFNYDSFWDEVRKRSDGKRRILISEYTAPSDFTLVLHAKSRTGLRIKDADANMVHELRADNLYEYQPPKGRALVSFASYLDEESDEVPRLRRDRNKTQAPS
jgi:DNA adenine methylase